jgi:hypothetical protein
MYLAMRLYELYIQFQSGEKYAWSSRVRALCTVFCGLTGKASRFLQSLFMDLRASTS